MTCLLFSYLLAVTCVAGEQIRERRGVLFKEETTITFSESAWTLVTHVSMRETRDFTKSLEEWITRQLEAVQKVTRKNINLALLRDLVMKRTANIQRRLDGIKIRLEETLEVTSTGRRKRGLVDGVGTGLQWLFGVSTTKDSDHLDKRVEELSKDRDDLTHLI